MAIKKDILYNQVRPGMICIGTDDEAVKAGLKETFFFISVERTGPGDVKVYYIVLNRKLAQFRVNVLHGEKCYKILSASYNVF